METQLAKYWKTISDNFKTIRLCFFAQLPHPDCEDILQDAIIKVANYIKRKGLKENSDFIAYLFLTYRNLIYNLNQKKQRLNFIDVSTLSDGHFITNEEEDADALRERKEKERIVEDIFKFVDKNFTPIESGLFKYYHKTKLTYKQISELTGYSFSYIWKKNAIILKVIKNKYGDYIDAHFSHTDNILQQCGG